MSVLHINFAFYRHFTLGSVNVYNALRSIHIDNAQFFFLKLTVKVSLFLTNYICIYLHSIIKKL